MPQINLTMEEHQHLTKLVARSYDNLVDNVCNATETNLSNTVRGV